MANSIWLKMTDLWEADGWQSLLGTLSHTLAPERWGPALTERIFWHAQTSEPVLALSFDDGPNPIFTPRLLRILDRHAVPATFFLIGRHVQKYPEIARSIASHSHEIGNHTFHHRMLPFFSNDFIENEITRTHRLIREFTGQAPNFLRPPMGLFTRRTVDVIESCGYKTVVGDVYPRDPNKPGTQKIIARVLLRVQPGSLIIMHDGGNSRTVDRSQTLAAVDALIPRLKANGFKFVKLSELMQGAFKQPA